MVSEVLYVLSVLFIPPSSFSDIHDLRALRLPLSSLTQSLTS